MDFVHDQLATGRPLRVLTIVDTFSRFSPALEPLLTPHHEKITHRLVGDRGPEPVHIDTAIC
jgi:putative transposase